MNWKRVMQLIGFLLLFTCLPAYAADQAIIIDAGLIEVGEGYMQVSEGFTLSYEGKRIAGDQFYFNTENGEYSLDQVSFSACIKERPHYKITAKRLEIYPGKSLVFSEVKLSILNQRVMVLPFRLVLNYRDGKYHFPDWLPEVFVSSEKGVGVRVSGSYQPTPALYVGGAASLSSKSAVDVELESKYIFTPDVLFNGLLAYDKQWSGNVGLGWRTDNEGLRGELKWSLLKEGGDERLASLGYREKGWLLNFALKDSSLTGFEPIVQMDTPIVKIGKMTHDFRAGVTVVTDVIAKKSHNKVYVTDSIKGKYSFGKSSLDAALTPTQVWVSGYGLAGQGQYNLSLHVKPSEHWNLNLGYRGTARWGVTIPTAIFDSTPEEYVALGFNYTTRNKLAEGWDLGVQSEYNLLTKKLSSLQVKVLKAYDCFDVQTDIDLVNVGVNLGLNLKY